MHQCKAAVLHCIDYRFQSAIADFLRSLGYGEQYDRVSIAGATKNLVDPYDASDPELVLRQIEIARKLHAITDVVLINHLDCGAYGKGTFVNEAEEVDRHKRDLARAAQLVAHRFSGLSVLTFLARKRPDGGIDFEKTGA